MAGAVGPRPERMVTIGGRTRIFRVQCRREIGEVFDGPDIGSHEPGEIEAINVRGASPPKLLTPAFAGFASAPVGIVVNGYPNAFLRDDWQYFPAD